MNWFRFTESAYYIIEKVLILLYIFYAFDEFGLMFLREDCPGVEAMPKRECPEGY